MQRYFFDVFDGVDMVDDVGSELPDLEAAKCEAVRASTELLSSHHADLWIGKPWTMKVREGSKIVCELSFIARVL